jgi:ABC-type dipeptide/oligopeptide/nickel transport system ATPase component
VEGVSFELLPGEIVGLVGESGCGKSVTSLSILGLHEQPAGRATGSIRLGEQELLGLPSTELRRVRGNRISMIFQDPLSSLNPYLRVEEQLDSSSVCLGRDRQGVGGHARQHDPARVHHEADAHLL